MRGKSSSDRACRNFNLRDEKEHATRKRDVVPFVSSFSILPFLYGSMKLDIVTRLYFEIEGFIF